MFKQLLAGAAALTLVSGAALAQSVTTETTTTRSQTTPLPPVGSVSQSKSEKTIDGNGTETLKSESYKSGDGRTARSSSTTVRDSDGSLQSSHHEEWSQAPTGSTTTTTTTRVERQ